MIDAPSWIALDAKGRLATAPRPGSGKWLESDLVAFRKAGGTGLVSVLEDWETKRLDIASEKSLCRALGIWFRSHPMPDRQLPTDAAAFWDFARGLQASVASGQSVVVHCRAGIGRSTLMAAAAMVIHGVGAAEALAAISVARGLPVPDTEAQREWFLAEAARQR